MPKIIPLYETGMVFGVFDGFHPGHQHFLSEATQLCQKLIVVVAHPDMVSTLKNRTPHHSLTERIETIQSHNSSWEVISGDQKIGTWSALKKYQPAIVLLGYDQERLGRELKKNGIAYRFITALEPEKYKPSLLHAGTTTTDRSSLDNTSP